MSRGKTGEGGGRWGSRGGFLLLSIAVKCFLTAALLRNRSHRKRN